MQFPLFDVGCYVIVVIARSCNDIYVIAPIVSGRFTPVRVVWWVRWRHATARGRGRRQRGVPEAAFRIAPRVTLARYAFKKMRHERK